MGADVDPCKKKKSKRKEKGKKYILPEVGMSVQMHIMHLPYPVLYRQRRVKFVHV